MQFSSLRCTHGQKVTTAVVFLPYIEQSSIENKHTYFSSKQKERNEQLKFRDLNSLFWSHVLHLFSGFVILLYLFFLSLSNKIRR